MKKRRERRTRKRVGYILGYVSEVTKGVRSGKSLTFPTDERVFGKLKDRFGMISGQNIKGVSFRRWVAKVPYVSRLFTIDSTIAR